MEHHFKKEVQLSCGTYDVEKIHTPQRKVDSLWSGTEDAESVTKVRKRGHEGSKALQQKNIDDSPERTVYMEQRVYGKDIFGSKGCDGDGKAMKRCFICGNVARSPMRLDKNPECSHIACCLSHLHELHNKWVDIKADLLDMERSLPSGVSS